jgi:hypothetical protein
LFLKNQTKGQSSLKFPTPLRLIFLCEIEAEIHQLKHSAAKHDGNIKTLVGQAKIEHSLSGYVLDEELLDRAIGA